MWKCKSINVHSICKTPNSTLPIPRCKKGILYHECAFEIRLTLGASLCDGNIFCEHSTRTLIKCNGETELTRALLRLERTMTSLCH